MKHLSEEQQVEMYYDEGSDEAKAHLKVCRECSAEYAKYKRSLDAIKPEDAPLRGPEYGDCVWQALRPQLIPYEKKTAGWRDWSWWKISTAAIACMALLTAAFIGGRYWEQRKTNQPEVAGNAQPQPRVVVVVLTDHLDRTERLLVQLNHANPQDRSGNAELQTEAKELLASNRLYRVSANKEGDPAVAGALDRLERVLAEIANAASEMRSMFMGGNETPGSNTMNATATPPARRQLQTPQPPASSFPYNPGSLLSVMDLSLPAISGLLARATALENQDPLTRDRILFKRRIALLFYESSTRTRTSFELAAKSLGADTTLVSSLSSSIEKGETLKDTGLTLRALGAEAIIIRHSSSGAPWLLEQETRLPILNAGDGMHEHPTQALLDLRTILTHLDITSKTVILSGARAENAVEGPTVSPDMLSGVTITIVGDILHSRVARSNMLLLPRLGARVILCGPPQLLPDSAVSAGPGISVERDFEAALRQSQVVMMLRIQAERLAGQQIDLAQYKDAYQLTGQRLSTQAPTALVLHPGPIIRGLELTAGVADGPQSAILEQVRHGVAIRMAVVEHALTAQPKADRA